jgi:sensor histidine kinase YesM
VAGWGVVALAILYFAHAYKSPLSTNVILGRVVVVFVAGILITHTLRSFLKWRGWMFQSIEKVVPKLLAAVIVTSVLFSLIVPGCFRVIRFTGATGDQSDLPLQTAWLCVRQYFIDLSVGSYFIIFIILSRRTGNRKMDTLQLEALIKELELKTIKAHINPHFIFNSLNSIRALIDENPSRARTAITELSNILRSSMQVDKAETVSFEKELNIVKDYLALENMRFEDRLKVEYEIDEDTLDQQVPPMMLQTLVENAIKHGISKHIRGGTIKIISDFKNHYHELAVQNTGNLNGGLNAEGFGLSSTQNRLGLLYGDKASFEIKQVAPSIVEARVLIPVQMN